MLDISESKITQHSPFFWVLILFRIDLDLENVQTQTFWNKIESIAHFEKTKIFHRYCNDYFKFGFRKAHATIISYY